MGKQKFRELLCCKDLFQVWVWNVFQTEPALSEIHGHAIKVSGTLKQITGYQILILMDQFQNCSRFYIPPNLSRAH